MSTYLPSNTCAAALPKILTDAIVAYLDDRERWVVQPDGIMRPVAQRRIGVCALCGTVLETHFVVTARGATETEGFLGKATAITPGHPKYNAVRKAYIEKEQREDVSVSACYFCPETARPIGRLPIRPNRWERPELYSFSAWDAADAIRRKKAGQAKKDGAGREANAAKTSQPVIRTKAQL